MNANFKKKVIGCCVIFLLVSIFISPTTAKIDLTGSSDAVGGNPFDQTLNTGDDVVFNQVTSTFVGDGSGVTGINASHITTGFYNPFDQDLNTTDSPIFAGLTLTGLNGFLKATGGVVGTSTIGVSDITDISTNYLQIDGSNANQDIDIGNYDFTAHYIIANSLFGDGGNLTNLTCTGCGNPFNQDLNTTDNATFFNITANGWFIGNGSLLTNVPCCNLFNQNLNTTNDVIFNKVTSIFHGDGGNLTNVSCTAPFNYSGYNQNLNTTDNVTFWNVTVTGWFIGNGSQLTGLTDNDTTYSAGGGLNLTGTVFSINGSIFGQNLTWDGNFLNATGGGATYLNGVGLNLSGTTFSFNITWGDSRYALYSHSHPFNYSGYNQDLNTTSNVTFFNITSNGYFLGNGSQLTGILAGNPFDQDLNTTDAVTFATVDTGQGANELYDMDQNVLTTSKPTFGGMKLTGFDGFLQAISDTVNAVNLYNVFLNLSGNNSNQDIDIGNYDFAANEVHATTLFGDGGNLTNITCAGGGNPFNQDLNTTDNASFTNLDIDQNINLSDTLSFNNDFSFSRQSYNGNYLELAINDAASRYLYLTNAGSGYLGLWAELLRLTHPTATFYLESNEAGGSGMTGVSFDTNNEYWLISNENAYGNNFLFRDADASIDCIEIENDVGNVLIEKDLNVTGSCRASFFYGEGGNLTNISTGNLFNQELNTTDSPTFAGLTLTGFDGFLRAISGTVGAYNLYNVFLNLSGNNSNQDLNIGIYDLIANEIHGTYLFGDGGNITKINANNITTGFYNPFNQDLNTTNSPTFAKISTGHGSNELYAMNQDVETSDAVTFVTVNTGHGANELYSMNQDVETSDKVEFAMVQTGGAHEVIVPLNSLGGIAVEGESEAPAPEVSYETWYYNIIETAGLINAEWDSSTVVQYLPYWYEAQEHLWSASVDEAPNYDMIFKEADAFEDEGFLGVGVDNPEYRVHLPETEDESGSGIAFDWATYSDNRIKDWINELPANKVMQFCENVTIQMYNPINCTHNPITGALEFGETDYTKVNAGISAQDLYEYVSTNFNEKYANSVVHKPVNETSTLWGVSYRNVQMIFDRMVQINHDRITNMENFLMNYGYDPNEIY